MKRNMKRLIISAISAVMIISLMTGMVSAVEESAYGTAGVITEAPRNPDNGDSSNWLTIQSEEAGTRMVTKDNREVVAVDNYGGIYLNGDVYVKGKLLDTEIFRIGNGFMYLLLVISITLNVVVLVKSKKNK